MRIPILEPADSPEQEEGFAEISGELQKTLGILRIISIQLAQNGRYCAHLAVAER